jgi:hypothetical protein
MKLHQIFLAVLFIIICVTTSNGQVNQTIIRGKVKNWPTDSIYLQTMPFHSPHSIELKTQILSKDGTFAFVFENRNKPFIIQLYSKKREADTNKKELLFLNYTDKYYYGHCVKFYTYGASTFLVEPNTILEVELTSNRSQTKLNQEDADRYKKAGAIIASDNMIDNINETGIRFIGSDSIKNEYYQKTFDIEDKIDNRLELYQNKPIEEAIISYKKISTKLLNELESNRDNLSSVFYNYIKAEIEFGARLELLKLIMFPQKGGSEEILNTFFSNEIPKELTELIEFDKTTITPSTLISEEYNKFLEVYINFKINSLSKKFSRYNEFSIQKCKTAIKYLPEESAYCYLANHLLQTVRQEEFVESLITSMIKKFPNGDLNEKLMKLYDL